MNSIDTNKAIYIAPTDRIMERFLWQPDSVWIIYVLLFLQYCNIVFICAGSRLWSGRILVKAGLFTCGLQLWRRNKRRPHAPPEAPRPDRQLSPIIAHHYFMARRRRPWRSISKWLNLSDFTWKPVWFNELMETLTWSTRTHAPASITTDIEKNISCHNYHILRYNSRFIDTLKHQRSDYSIDITLYLWYR